MGAYHAHRQGLRTEPHPFPLVVPSRRGFPHGRPPRRLPRSRDAHVGQGRRAGRSALRLLPPRDARHPQGVRQPPLVRPLLQRQRDHRQLRLHRGADRRRPQTRHAASVQRFDGPHARPVRPVLRLAADQQRPREGLRGTALDRLGPQQGVGRGRSGNFPRVGPAVRLSRLPRDREIHGTGRGPKLRTVARDAHRQRHGRSGPRLLPGLGRADRRGVQGRDRGAAPLVQIGRISAPVAQRLPGPGLRPGGCARSVLGLQGPGDARGLAGLLRADRGAAPLPEKRLVRRRNLHGKGRGLQLRRGGAQKCENPLVDHRRQRESHRQGQSEIADRRHRRRVPRRGVLRSARQGARPAEADRAPERR